MKTPSEELHQLVQSLGQNEKRYFMMQASGSARSYLELFRLVNSQNSYDESAIRKKMNVKDARLFKKLKHYTFQSVLKTLENYFGSSSNEILAMRKFIQAEILYNKKLFSHSRKAVRSVLKMAEDKDLLFFIPPCYEWLYKLGVASAKPHHSIKEINTAKVKKAVADCGRWLELKHLNTLFWNIIHNSLTVGKEETKILNRIIRESNRIINESVAGFTIKREVFLLLGLAHRFNSQMEQAYIYRKKLIGLIESEQAYIHERAHQYISALGNLINVCREMNKGNEVMGVFEKANAFMNRLPKKYSDFRLDETFCNLQNNYVTFLFSLKKYDETIQQGSGLLYRIKKHSEGFQNSLLSILYQNLMYSFFYRKDLRSALRFHHLHMKMNDKEDTPRWLFGLVILFEMMDFDALHYRCRSLQYYLHKTNKHTEAEMLLVKTFGNKLQKKYSSREMRSDFEKLLSEMKKHRKQYDEIHKEYKFDYMEWVKNKAEQGK